MDEQTESVSPSPAQSADSQADEHAGSNATDEVTADDDSMLDDIMSDFDDI
jgi:hypothetical protein